MVAKRNVSLYQCDSGVLGRANELQLPWKPLAISAPCSSLMALSCVRVQPLQGAWLMHQKWFLFPELLGGPAGCPRKWFGACKYPPRACGACTEVASYWWRGNWEGEVHSQGSSLPGVGGLGQGCCGAVVWGAAEGPSQASSHLELSPSGLWPAHSALLCPLSLGLGTCYLPAVSSALAKIYVLPPPVRTWALRDLCLPSTESCDQPQPVSTKRGSWSECAPRCLSLLWGLLCMGS